MALTNEEIIECGKLSLFVEKKAIDSIIDNSINNTFCEFISIILNTKGRVFFSAVGKPGYIARKVAATLASTGTPSFYIHPTEASHGDLGMITDNDIVVLLEKNEECGGSIDESGNNKRNSNRRGDAENLCSDCREDKSRDYKGGSRDKGIAG